MTDPNNDPKNLSVNAENNSIAVGSISAGGDISGNIHIGNVYQTPEDDLPLSSDEIENGLSRFAQFLPERAPVLQDSFSSIAKKLRATLGADQSSLSPALKAQREDGVDRMKLMCMEVTDISFRAICLGQNPPPYDSRPPFLGLFAFHPKDREFFFGREALVQKLVARIKGYPFLAVLGASGSGKSSLVMAGLIPALEAEMSYLTPSTVPLYQLLEAKESAGANTVFVIDQFEELFTHPHDAAGRADFIHELLELTKTNRVVITMRADFWGEVAIYNDLKQAMQEHQELIAPMNVDELHSAMEKQAAVVGLRFDPTLNETILAEVKGEPGAMPLLQHTLWELWNRRHGLWIKAEEYQAFGGVKKAIASTAEEVYASCSDFERARVRDIFLRLTRLDESGEGRDTRRRVLIEELIPVNSDSSVTINLLNKLADARLIVKTDKDVEVAHEALIRHWSRLTEWLNEDRDNLRLREGVSESAREWENSKRDDSLLNHRGGRLELALAMSKLPRYQLNPIEQVYLNACMALRNKEQREREQRLRWTVIASIATAIIFLVLGSFGWVKSNEAIAQAETAQANANAASTSQVNAENEEQRAEEQAKIAIASQLFIQAQSGISKGVDEDVILLLAIQSMRLFPSVASSQIIQDTTSPGIFEVNSDSFSDNSISDTTVFFLFEKYLISSDYTVLHIWNVGTEKIIASLTIPTDSYPFSISADGNYILSGSCSQLVDITGECIQATIGVWDVSTGKEIAHIIQDALISNGLQFAQLSPDGRYVALVECNEFGGEIVGTYTPITTCIQSIAHIYEAATNKEIRRITNDNDIVAVAFSPDGKYVVAGGSKGTVSVLELTSGKETNYIKQNSFTKNVTYVSFSPDGKHVAASGDGGIILWETDTSQEATRIATDKIYYQFFSKFSFSPDSKHLASLYAGEAGINIWEVSTGKKITNIQSSNYMRSVNFSPDGDFLIGIDDSLGIQEFVWKSQEQIARACSNVSRNLTHAEWAQYIGDALPYQAICPNLPLEAESTPLP